MPSHNLRGRIDGRRGLYFHSNHEHEMASTATFQVFVPTVR